MLSVVKKFFKSWKAHACLGFLTCLAASFASPWWGPFCLAIGWWLPWGIVRESWQGDWQGLSDFSGHRWAEALAFAGGGLVASAIGVAL